MFELALLSRFTHYVIMSTVIYKHIMMFKMRCSQIYVTCDISGVNPVFSSSNSRGPSTHENITRLYWVVLDLYKYFT